MFSHEAQNAAGCLALFGIFWVVLGGIICFTQYIDNDCVGKNTKKVFWLGVLVFHGPMVLQLYMRILFA